MPSRVKIEGISAPGTQVAFKLAGNAARAGAGQSVAAAMVELCELACRTTPQGEPRGIFCGMGVCQDCVVEIDGVGRRRSCMTKVAEDMAIRQGSPRAAAVLSEAKMASQRLAPKVLVVGGGPAGLSAASVIAESGLSVVLVDERLTLGGQFYKQPADGREVNEAAIDHQFQSGRRLIRRFEASGATYLGGTTVWGVFGATQVAASDEHTNFLIEPSTIVLATGAYERGVPMPGWTLPGFMTTGAMQTLLRSYQVTPGQRVVLSGNGPLNLQVAVELTRAGVHVVGLAELARKPGPWAWRQLLTMGVNAPQLVADGLRHVNELKQLGVPIFYESAVISARGRTSVEVAKIAQVDSDGRPISGTEKELTADVVCIGFGFVPSNEIARTLGCNHHYDPVRRILVPERSETGKSSIDNVWIVGDCAGLSGARSAEQGGLIAGAAVVEEQGQLTQKLRIERDRAVILRRQALRFQSALWSLYSAPAILDQFAEAETLVCRCEAVTLGSLNQAIAEELDTAGAVKRMTRAGMGPCQGRYCGPFIVDLVARERHGVVDELSYFAPRVPFRPQPLSALAGIAKETPKSQERI